MKTKPNGYWTYEKCKEVTLKCETKYDMYNNHGTVYNKIMKNKWFELQEHFTSSKKSNGYWTYEKCKESALECETKSEFMINFSSAYNIVRKNKWYDLFEHMTPIGNKYKRLIYVYEFDDNYCYIGLTGNLKRRNIQHIFQDKKSSVFLHIENTNRNPILLIKTNYVNVDDAILLEEKILNDYKNKGWNILNKTKTGGIGSNVIKWNKNACKMEALKYDNASQFDKKSSGAYHSAAKYGWLDEFFPMTSKNGHWNNKELCKKEATKYKNRSEFCYGCWSAYNYSNINNWLNEFFPKYYKSS